MAHSQSSKSTRLKPTARCPGCNEVASVASGIAKCFDCGTQAPAKDWYGTPNLGFNGHDEIDHLTAMRLVDPSPRLAEEEPDEVFGIEELRYHNIVVVDREYV